MHAQVPKKVANPKRQRIRCEGGEQNCAPPRGLDPATLRPSTSAILATITDLISSLSKTLNMITEGTHVS